MSFFPGSFVSSPQTSSFTPLFRLLEDFENYQQPTRRAGIKSFQPKFDVTEHTDSYELHGELPGIEKKDVEIEFTDRQTLSIRGRIERSYTSGTPPSGAVEAPKAAGALTEGGESHSHKATVEDAEDAEASQTGSPNNQVSKPAQNTEVAKGNGQVHAKHWVSERSVGQFSRSFSFPESIDQDAVKASMKNGILSILVPKAAKHQSRRVQIQE
ncbi:hsp20-like protein [Phlyctema vagabunda]|uniref:Hsp20-like protein n=1 Tax=Phlyctema vagabunda TaxID=108571 RepID=A0ABR4P1W2_9HELO